MPDEFWREVVDRVAAEVPDTLLLAEAFWLLEGYFVRTLGMHRVYNSAFMNMLRDEENAKLPPRHQEHPGVRPGGPEALRQLHEQPRRADRRRPVRQGRQVLRRRTLMATLPGLPMFGHGQIEGFTEKYGMEYRRAYWDEAPEALARRAPRARDLPAAAPPPPLRRRARLPALRLLRPGRLGQRGRLRLLQPGGRRARPGRLPQPLRRGPRLDQDLRRVLRPGRGGGRRLVQRSLGEALGLHPDGEWYTILREQRSGLEFIRKSADLCRDGLFVDLHAYGCQVFLDIHELEAGADGRLAAAGRAPRRRRRPQRRRRAARDAARAAPRGGPGAGRREARAARVAPATGGPASAIGEDRDSASGREGGPAGHGWPTAAPPEAKTEAEALDEATAAVGRILNALVDVAGASGDVPAPRRHSAPAPRPP